MNYNTWNGECEVALIHSCGLFSISFMSLIVLEINLILCNCIYLCGMRGGIVVKALRYKPAGRGFDSRWCHWNFSVT